jgi:hypothetical protein
MSHLWPCQMRDLFPKKFTGTTCWSPSRLCTINTIYFCPQDVYKSTTITSALCFESPAFYLQLWQRLQLSPINILALLQNSVYSFKALIANLLAAKGLSRLRAGLRAQIKGLTIIINLICNLLGSPRSHLLATPLNVLVLWKYLTSLSSGHLSSSTFASACINSDSAFISAGSSHKA